MRLFKLLVITLVIGSIYFYAKQQSGETQKWNNITTPEGISIKFPAQPVSKTFKRYIAPIGNIRLTTYQVIVENQALVLLSASPENPDFRQRRLSELEEVIHLVNDTKRMRISHKRAFVQQSYRGIEYKATSNNGHTSWCRTVKRDDQLHSIIFASTRQNPDNRLRDTFFQSLRL